MITNDNYLFVMPKGENTTSGGSSLIVNGYVFVDGVLGDNLTAIRNDASKPAKDITFAQTLANNGDVIVIWNNLIGQGALNQVNKGLSYVIYANQINFTNDILLDNEFLDRVFAPFCQMIGTNIYLNISTCIIRNIAVTNAFIKGGISTTLFQIGVLGCQNFTLDMTGSVKVLNIDKLSVSIKLTIVKGTAIFKISEMNVGLCVFEFQGDATTNITFEGFYNIANIDLANNCNGKYIFRNCYLKCNDVAKNMFRVINNLSANAILRFEGNNILVQTAIAAEFLTFLAIPANQLKLEVLGRIDSNKTLTLPNVNINDFISGWFLNTDSNIN